MTTTRNSTDGLASASDQIPACQQLEAARLILLDLLEHAIERHEASTRARADATTGGEER